MLLHFGVASHHVAGHHRRGPSIVDNLANNLRIFRGFIAAMDAVKMILFDNYYSVGIDVIAKFDVSAIRVINRRARPPIAATVIRFIGRDGNPADMASAVNPGDPRGIPGLIAISSKIARPPIPTPVIINPPAVMMRHPAKALVGHP